MDNQSTISSSVAPSDSVSTTQSKRSKPGKAERAARRSAVGSQPGQSASAQKASVFASGVVVPKPQPGKFPVVFQTGAGEPSRDLTFGIDDVVLKRTLASVPGRFVHHERYAEFTQNAEISDDQFRKDITVTALLRLAQQVVHSHVNMGLPQGDFAPVASTDVVLPASVAAYISQFGEFAVPALGTRYLLSSYEDTVKAIVMCADKCRQENGSGAPFGRLWLPMSMSDTRSKAIIAGRLLDVLRPHDLAIDQTVLEDAVYSGSVPDAWESIKSVFGDSDDRKDRFDFVFRSYPGTGQFLNAFTTDAATAALVELNLTWANPSAGHLDWQFNAKQVFTTLADAWARKVVTYAKFFEMSSGLTSRTSATGSQSQMAIVTESDSVTVVKTHLALSAPEFSLVACFPATGVFSGGLTRRVVVTTPLSVRQRATEFVLMDWR